MSTKKFLSKALELGPEHINQDELDGMAKVDIEKLPIDILHHPLGGTIFKIHESNDHTMIEENYPSTWKIVDYCLKNKITYVNFTEVGQLCKDLL